MRGARVARDHLICVMKNMLSEAYGVESCARTRTRLGSQEVDILVHGPIGKKFAIEVPLEDDYPQAAVADRDLSVLETGMASALYRVSAEDALFELAHVLDMIHLNEPEFLTPDAGAVVNAICAREHFIQVVEPWWPYSAALVRTFGDVDRDLPRGKVVVLKSSVRGVPHIQVAQAERIPS